MATTQTYALGVLLLLQAAMARVNVTEAQVEAREAASRAEAAIAELDDWDAELRAGLANQSHAAAEAASILGRVWGDLRGKYEQAQQDFNARLSALGSEAMATANATEFGAAVRAAGEALRELNHLDDKVGRAMIDQLSEVDNAGQYRAHALQRSAREASRQVFDGLQAVAQGQREAGAPERVYEGTEGRAEQASERLAQRAERAAERAEGLVERRTGVLEYHLEALVDRLRDKASESREARKLRLQLTVRAVEDARREAREAAKDEALEKALFSNATLATAEGKGATGQKAEGQLREGQAQKAQAAEDGAAGGQAQRGVQDQRGGQSLESEARQVQADEGQATEGQAVQARAAEGRDADSQAQRGGRYQRRGQGHDHQEGQAERLQAAGGKAMEGPTAEGELAGRRNPPAAALVFLALTPSPGTCGGLILALACITTLGFVLRLRGSISGLERPLLV